jgi:hypothetical protein
MRRILLICLPLLCLTVQAQDMGSIRGGFDVSNFPDRVSFVYHIYNPQALAKSDFQYLKEGGKDREFDLIVLPENHSDEPQTTLFLWEDMAHNGRGQFDFTKNVLSGFFDETNITGQDKFAVSVFNRRKNAPSVLKNLTNGFVADKSQLMQTVEQYRMSTEHYPQFPNRSDMYSAIREGLEKLQPLEGAKSIVVFTAGYSMKNSGSDSESQVLLQAQRLHIPVYIIQYYYKSGVAPESEGFAESTNGTFYSYLDVESAKADLVRIYPQMRDRYFGHSYRITFQSDAKRGDEARVISLKVRGEELQEQFLPPSFSLKGWIRGNVWLFIGIVAVLLILVGLAIWIIRRSIVRRNRRIEEKEAEMQSRILASDRNVENIKRQQEEEKRREREEAARKAHKAEEEHLAQLMRTKNLYPRLQCRVSNNTFNYTMDKPHITLGRKGYGADVELDSDKVSRNHAEIIFTGGGFEIVDKKSTNKVVVNGVFFDRATLKGGDIIGLGEAVITFYV